MIKYSSICSYQILNLIMYSSICAYQILESPSIVVSDLIRYWSNHRYEVQYCFYFFCSVIKLCVLVGHILNRFVRMECSDFNLFLLAHSLDRTEVVYARV